MVYGERLAIWLGWWKRSVWSSSQCWGLGGEETSKYGLQTLRHLWSWTCVDLYTEGTRDGTGRGGDNTVWEGSMEWVVPGGAIHTPPWWVLEPGLLPKAKCWMVTDVLTCPGGAWSTQSSCSCLHLTYFYHPNIIFYACHDGKRVRKPCYSLMV